MELQPETKKWITILVVVVVLTIIVSFITAKLSIGIPQGTQEQSVYNKVINSGTIHSCYVPYIPAMVKDPNSGKLSGIFYDTLNKAAENMGLKIDWSVQSDWGSMIADLNSGKCDIVGSDSWSNSTRGKSAEFGLPLYYSAIDAYVRAGDNRFDANPLIANDSKYTVVYVDGETSQTIVRRQFPNAKTISLPQTADVSLMLLNVVENKADMAFVEPAIANQFLKTHPDSIKPADTSKPVAVYGNVMMIKKGEFAFQTAINNALTELLDSGYVDQIIDQYAKQYPGVYYRVAKPYVISQ